MHMDLFWHLYKKYGGKHVKAGQRFHMTVVEFEDLIIHTGIMNSLLTQRDIGTCFFKAMQTQVDELDKDKHLHADFIRIRGGTR